jgi:hypothetical protein
MVDDRGRYWPTVAAKLIPRSPFNGVADAGQSRRRPDRRDAESGDDQKNKQRF